MKSKANNLFKLLMIVFSIHTSAINPSYSKPLDPVLNLKEAKAKREIYSSKKQTFEDSFYSHTKPYVSETTIFGRLRSFLGITIGGKDKNNFYGIGFKDKSIQWDAIAVENHYRKRIEEHYIPNRMSGSDIPNGYNGSLLGSQAR